MRATAADLQESRMREVANAGLGREDVLALWFGESDEAAPPFIRAAAIARYMTALLGPIGHDRLGVWLTESGSCP